MSEGRLPAVPAGCSRALVLPGDVPPLSHLGATVLRHVLGGALRYALYQLALPMPERGPVRLVALRPYLDAGVVAAALLPERGAPELLAAMADPGGAAATPHGLRRMAPRVWAASQVQSWRLRFPLLRRRVGRRSAAAGWSGLRDAVSRGIPVLGDALLGELVEALRRRALRARGEHVIAALGPAASAFLRGRVTRATRLGPPDLRCWSWAEEPPDPPVPSPVAMLDQPLRGGARETLRALLGRWRPLVFALAERATTCGVLSCEDDAFFLPFEVAHHLEDDEPLPWIAAAVASNRREHAALTQIAAPPDQGGRADPARWLPAPWAPLQPLF